MNQHQKSFLILAILLSCSSIIISSDNDSIDQITPVLLIVPCTAIPASIVNSPISIINPQIHMNYYNLVQQSVRARRQPRTFKIQCCTKFSCFKIHQIEEEIITAPAEEMHLDDADFFISRQTKIFNIFCCICQVKHKYGLESVEE